MRRLLLATVLASLFLGGAIGGSGETVHADTGQAIILPGPLDCTVGFETLFAQAPEISSTSQATWESGQYAAWIPLLVYWQKDQSGVWRYYPAVYGEWHWAHTFGLIQSGNWYLFNTNQQETRQQFGNLTPGVWYSVLNIIYYYPAGTGVPYGWSNWFWSSPDPVGSGTGFCLGD
ncbi:MAG: hypothetical protein M3P30_14910 [Chloroflexota bacterium]|nr:hypothetical protein [Chloroflexota bacterium]